MAISITISNLKQTSFTATASLSGLVEMKLEWFLNGTSVATIIAKKGTKSSTYSPTGLSPGTRYTVGITARNNVTDAILDKGSVSVTTTGSSGGGDSGGGDSGGGDDGGGDSGGGGGDDDTKQRPSNWYWNSNVAKGASLSLPATEWNDFIDRIGEFAIYKGVTLNSGYLTDAVAYSGGKMLASQGRAAKYLIDQLDPPTDTPAPVYSGNTITADFFLGLRGALNSIQ